MLAENPGGIILKFYLDTLGFGYGVEPRSARKNYENLAHPALKIFPLAQPHPQNISPASPRPYKKPKKLDFGQKNHFFRRAAKNLIFER